MTRSRRFWWLLLGVAGLLVAGGVAAVLLLRHDNFEEKVAQIDVGMTVDDVVKIMGRPADGQEPVTLNKAGEIHAGVSDLRWTNGRHTLQVVFSRRGAVLDAQIWQNQTLLERLRNWLGW